MKQNKLSTITNLFEGKKEVFGIVKNKIIALV